MFDRELDYYGITSAADITGQESFSSVLNEAQRKLDLFSLVYECQSAFCGFILNKPRCDEARLVISASDEKRKKLYNALRTVCSGSDKKLFDTYLDAFFGMTVTRSTAEVNYNTGIRTVQITLQGEK